MRYYSDKTKSLYENENELIKAEEEFDKAHEEENRKREERKTRAKEVETAYKHYLELRNQFIEDYGSYHMTVNSQRPYASIFDFIEDFWLK